MTREEIKFWNRKVRLLEKTIAIMEQQKSQRSIAISFYEAISLFLTSGFSSNDLNKDTLDSYLIDRGSLEQNYGIK